MERQTIFSWRHYLWLFVLTGGVMLGWSYPIVAQADGTSIATNNQSEWLSTSSGWTTDRQNKGVRVPTGDYVFRDKHWFEPPAAGEPQLYDVYKTYRKPPANRWDTTFGTDERTTALLVNGREATYATSRWFVRDYTSVARFGPQNPEYYSLYQTKSIANASSQTETNIAGSRTDIRDPVTMVNPGTGNWSIRNDFAMFGDLTATTNESYLQYDFGLSLTPNGSPTDVLSIRVGAKSAEITVNDSFLSSFGGHLVFADENGEIESRLSLQSKLNSFYTADGWQLNPSSFDINTFLPDNSTHVSEVFATQIFLQIPAQYSTATVYTDRLAVALAPVPEPSNALLMLVGLGYLAFLKRCSNQRKRFA
jgi:hypothetical protein